MMRTTCNPPTQLKRCAAMVGHCRYTPLLSLQCQLSPALVRDFSALEILSATLRAAFDVVMPSKPCSQCHTHLGSTCGVRMMSCYRRAHVRRILERRLTSDGASDAESTTSWTGDALPDMSSRLPQMGTAVMGSRAVRPSSGQSCAAVMIRRSMAVFKDRQHVRRVRHLATESGACPDGRGAAVCRTGSRASNRRMPLPSGWPCRMRLGAAVQLPEDVALMESPK